MLNILIILYAKKQSPILKTAWKRFLHVFFFFFRWNLPCFSSFIIAFEKAYLIRFGFLHLCKTVSRTRRNGPINNYEIKLICNFCALLLFFSFVISRPEFEPPGWKMMPTRVSARQELTRDENLKRDDLQMAQRGALVF